MQCYKESNGTMSRLKKYMELKKRVEQAQQKADKAEGALEQVMKQLKENFDCPTLEAAKRKLKLLEKQKQDMGIKFDNEVKEFEEKWSDESDDE